MCSLSSNFSYLLIFALVVCCTYSQGEYYFPCSLFSYDQGTKIEMENIFLLLILICYTYVIFSVHSYLIHISKMHINASFELICRYDLTREMLPFLLFSFFLEGNYFKLSSKLHDLELQSNSRLIA